MHPFRVFFEKKAYTLSSEENKQVEKILKNYNTLLNPERTGADPEKVVSKSPLYNKEKRTLLLGLIEYYDPIIKDNGEVTVVVSFESSIGARGAFMRGTNTIELFYEDFDNLTENLKRNTIAHELFHAKQHYRKQSPEARRAIHKRTLADGRITIRSQRGYYLEPTELPVQIASITHEMDRQYNAILKHIKLGKNVKFWERQRLGFLQLLEKFLRSPSLKGFPLPSYLQDQEGFIATLFRNKNHPKYAKAYKDFKSKLHWYYDRLRKMKAVPSDGEVPDEREAR